MRALALLLVALLCATPAAATVTVGHFSSYDVNANNTNATVAQFSGGVAGTSPPKFITNTVFPGTLNKIAVDLNAAYCAGGTNAGAACTNDLTCTGGGTCGGTSSGTVLLGATQSQISVGLLAYPTLGAIAKCVGGAKNGKICLDDTQCSSLFSHDGVCTPQRIPLVTLHTASGTGCVLYQSQTCGSVTENAAGDRTCGGESIKYEVMYGASQQLTPRGVCSSSRSMDGTPCGGPCTDATKLTDCVQGRASSDLANGSAPAACVKNIDETTPCAGGDTSADCHCINECDENRLGESQCAAGTIASVIVPPNAAVGLRVEQTNGTAPGDVACTLGSGIINSANRPEIFPRGTTPFSLQRVGICSGGTYPEDGGRKGTACCGAATCADGLPGDCSCLTTINGLPNPAYNAATCNLSGGAPTCTTSARVSPDRFTLGSTITAATRTIVDQVFEQQGTGTHARNWRGENSRVTGGTDGFTGTRTCTAGSGNCFNANGAHTEPDSNTTSVQTANESVDETVTFEPLKTTGTDYNAADQPVAAGINFAVQDRAPTDSEGVILKIEAFDGSTTTSGYNPSARSPSCCPTCSGSATSGFCGQGYWVQLNDTRGSNEATDFYEQMPPKLITTNITSGTALNALSTANAISAVNALQGKIRKNGFDGAGAGTTTAARLTYALRETVLAIANPTPPAVLPGNDRLAYTGDSRCDKVLLFQYLTSRLTEPSAIYKQCRGGVAMGDVVSSFAQLLAGGSGDISTQAFVGTAGQAVDVMFLEPGINTLHNAEGAVDPALPASREGIPQHGYCEDWLGTTYGPNQGKPCSCADDITNNWTTGGIGAFDAISLVKNSSFGTISSFPARTDGQPSCTTGNAPNGIGECQVGGSAPPGTITSTTCSGGKCTTTSGSNPNLDANAAAGNRVWKGIGCTGPATPVDTGAIGCSGVCMTGHSVARMMRAVHELTAIAARAPQTPTLVWVTTPPATSTTGTNDGLWGWWHVTPKVHQWNATLLAWAQANGKNWVDLSSYLFEKCGPATMLNASAVNACENDGIHYRPEVLAWEADLLQACATNTTLDGQTSKTTDGVCTAAAGGTCSGGVCGGTGLRFGLACTTDADCNYCSAGSPIKLGRKCTAGVHAPCGRYRCVFPS